MTPENLKAEITGWCDEKTGLQLVEDRSEAGSDVVLGIRSGIQGAGTVPVDVIHEDGSDRVTVRSTSTSSASETDIAALLAARPALVRGETMGTTTVVTAYIYTDGFTKQVFTTTVDEVAKTRSLLDKLGGVATGTATASTVSQPATSPEPAIAATPEPQPQPWSTRTPTPQPDPWSPAQLPAPSFGTPVQSAGYATPTGQPAPQAQPAAAAFAPTHTVPPQGMQAWAAPDPNGAIVATLGGGLPIQITEVRGAWAHVLCSNGWTGWVDGRIIGVAR